ncbi:hypothetical protein CBS101457_005302 [Exobasidium rhododendri]|nr:hypothetical protein CBS101457_005302 [Exobasidium rhododendri]
MSDSDHEIDEKPIAKKVKAIKREASAMIMLQSVRAFGLVRIETDQELYLDRRDQFGGYLEIFWKIPNQIKSSAIIKIKQVECVHVSSSTFGHVEVNATEQGLNCSVV